MFHPDRLSACTLALLQTERQNVFGFCLTVKTIVRNRAFEKRQYPFMLLLGYKNLFKLRFYLDFVYDTRSLASRCILELRSLWHVLQRLQSSIEFPRVD
jgi:hypothetical protein